MKWYTIEEAEKLCKTKPKKIMIDMYTDWCGWCKRMDANTFSQEEVQDYVFKNFYPVKLNAEQKENINFNGHTFKWMAGGRKGVNELAVSLTNGQLSYPTIVYLDEKFQVVRVAPGYKEKAQIMSELKYVKDELYKQVTYEQYKAKHPKD